MKNLLIINASGRTTRSITRRLTERVAGNWRKHSADSRINYRDLGLNPPRVIDEAWIAAAFADPSRKTEKMQAAMHDPYASAFGLSSRMRPR